MGYFWNDLERRWDPIDHDRVLTREQKEIIQWRKGLIEDLITEIEESHDSAIQLYAGLLARALASTDEVLLRGYGKRLAGLGLEGDKQQQNPERRKAVG